MGSVVEAFMRGAWIDRVDVVDRCLAGFALRLGLAETGFAALIGGGRFGSLAVVQR